MLLSALLTAKGPEGKTASQICKAVVGRKLAGNCNNLDYPDVEEQLNKIRTAIEQAKNENGTRIVNMANSAFLKKGFMISNGFRMGFPKMKGDSVQLVRLCVLFSLTPLSLRWTSKPRTLTRESING